jgi:hypothetical protein
MIKFRKSIQIAKGVKVNLTAKGISSLSLGANGATINLGKKRVKANIGISGTGISHSQNLTSHGKNTVPNAQINEASCATREVSFLLGTGILIMPYIFSWFLLQAGYSPFAKIISFSWLALLIYVATGA